MYKQCIQITSVLSSLSGRCVCDGMYRRWRQLTKRLIVSSTLQCSFFCRHYVQVKEMELNNLCGQRKGCRVDWQLNVPYCKLQYMLCGKRVSEGKWKTITCVFFSGYVLQSPTEATDLLLFHTIIFGFFSVVLSTLKYQQTSACDVIRIALSYAQVK